MVLQNPALRAVPFEQACAYAEENLEDMHGDSLSVGDDLSCHEVSAKDDTGTHSVPWDLEADVDRGGGSVSCDIAKISGTTRGNRGCEGCVDVWTTAIYKCSS